MLIPAIKKDSEVLDTIIIGGGIAGLTSAMYASRKRMKFAVLAKSPGGQMMEGGEILNYPGIKKTTGSGLASALMEQMSFNNVNVLSDEVRAISKKGNIFEVSSAKGKYKTKTVIIASGAKPRKLNVPGEKEYKNMGVYYCVICDGPLFSGEDVAILGGGNSALESADFMRNIAGRIYIINKQAKFTAHEYLQENVMEGKRFTVIHSADTKEILGNGKEVTGLRYESEGKQKEIKVKAVFIEIGRVPDTDFVKDLVKIDSCGHIVIDCQCAASIPGIFAAGDCASGHEYQYVIAAGQGCMALIRAARHIASLK